MADKRQAPADAARKASSSSDSDDEEVAQAFNSANHNNGSNSNHDVYSFSCQSRDQELGEVKHWLIRCVDKIHIPNERENGEHSNNRNSDNNGSVAMALYGDDNNSSPDGDYEGCVGHDLVENGDYDSSSTEGCDEEYEDYFIDEEDFLDDDDEDFLDDDDPIEGRDVDNDGTTDGHDDGGNSSTESEDTDSEESETSPFSRFLQRSNAFIRYIIRKAFDGTQ